MNADRVLDDLRELARLTGGPDGARRVCWTDEWATARQFLRSRLNELPVEIEIDEAGNLWAGLAGEQEAALRALIRGQDAVAAVGSGELDLTAELARLAAVRRVSLAGPDVPVLLPAATATGLVAAVAACLDNVARHVGDDAPAWVLLEELPDRVEVTVRDEGPGIPPEQRELVFERFGRGTIDGVTPRDGGTGLGLAIARWAVNLHGGTIAVAESRRGCRIRLTLPGNAKANS